MIHPLDGIQILDVGTLTPGKYCTYLLADLGADVIRIERPVSKQRPVDDEDLILNQGKRSATLNLRSAAGKDLFLELAAKADIIVEGNRPGTADRNNIGFEAIKRVNESIIYCAMSGYGATGPLSQSPGYDLIFLGVSGMLRALSGTGDSTPSNPHTYLADGITGLSAAYAITAALQNKERSGQGTFIDLAMLDSVFSLLAVSHGVRKLSSIEGAGAGGTHVETEADRIDVIQAEQPASPIYDIYAAADNTYLVLCAFREASRQKLFAHLGRPELITTTEPDEVRSFLREVFAQKPAEAWVEELAPLDIEIGRVNHPNEAFDHPQLRHRNMVGISSHPDAGKFEFIRPGLNANDSTARKQLTQAPRIGEDTAEVLNSIGVSGSALSEFRDEGVV